MLFTRQLAAAAAAAVVVANSVVVVVVVLHFGIKQSAPALDRHERKDANGKWWLEGAKRESKSIRTKQAEAEAGGWNNRSEQKARNQRHRAEFMCICDLSAEAERREEWEEGGGGPPGHVMLFDCPGYHCWPVAAQPTPPVRL